MLIAGAVAERREAGHPADFPLLCACVDDSAQGSMAGRPVSPGRGHAPLESGLAARGRAGERGSCCNGRAWIC